MLDSNELKAAIETITILGALTAGIVKPIVDAIKLAFPKLRNGAVPPLATLVGIALLLMLSVSTNEPITGQMFTQIVLASLFSAVGAAGINRLHDKANEKQEEVAQETAKQETAKQEAAAQQVAKQEAAAQKAATREAAVREAVAQQAAAREAAVREAAVREAAALKGSNGHTVTEKL